MMMLTNVEAAQPEWNHGEKTPSKAVAIEAKIL